MNSSLTIDLAALSTAGPFSGLGPEGRSCGTPWRLLPVDSIASTVAHLRITLSSRGSYTGIRFRTACVNNSCSSAVLCLQCYVFIVIYFFSSRCLLCGLSRTWTNYIQTGYKDREKTTLMVQSPLHKRCLWTLLCSLL